MKFIGLHVWKIFLLSIYIIQWVRPNPLSQIGSKYLNFAFYHYNQSFVNQVIERYSEMKNFHNTPILHALAPLIILTNELAKTQNYTLNAVPNYYMYNKFKENIEGQPTIVLDVYLSDIEKFKYNWLQFWTSSFLNPNLKKELPDFFLADSLAMNFAYCDTVRTKYESPWKLDIFTAPFDLYCWMTLLVALFVGSIVLAGSRDISRLETFTLLFSTMFSQTSNVPKNLGKSTLLIIWAFACLILTNLYLGNITSFIIRPPFPDIVRNLEQLVERNFSLLYPNWLWMYSSKVAFREHQNPFKNLSGPVYTSSGQYVDFLTEMTVKDRMAHYSVWPGAISIAVTANHILKRGQNNPMISKRRKCFVGKELIPASNFYYVFLPPHQTEIFMAYQRFFEVGIFRRWMDETIGLTQSRRVQDRSRVISPSEMVDDNLVEISPLKLDSRITKLFLLWGAKLGMSVSILVCEIMVKTRRVMLTKTKVETAFIT